MADISFTFKELQEFINSQPDDRPVNMHEPSSSKPCGCVLIHFGQSRYPNNSQFNAGYDCVNIDESIHLIINREEYNKCEALIMHFPKPTSYKSLKLIAQEIAGT